MNLRIRVAGLLMIFLSGWLAPPLKLALPNDPSCAMGCCQETGYCSCGMDSSGPSSVDGHDHSDFAWSVDQTPPMPGQMAAVIVGTSCGEKCAQVPSGLRNLAAHKSSNPEHSTEFNFQPTAELVDQISASETLLDESSGPRAPPAFLV